MNFEAVYNKTCANMERLKVMVQLRFVAILFVLALSANQGANGYNSYIVSPNHQQFEPHVVPFHRQRRAVPSTESATSSAAAASSTAVTTASESTLDHVTAGSAAASTPAAPAAVSTAGSTAAAPVSITQIPLLGRNGTGILRVNITPNTPKVSEPLYPDNNVTDIFKATEMLKSQQDLKNLTYDYHHFYNSTFIGNQTYFNEYWANLTKNQLAVHSLLSNSHRRATTLTLKFDFPFYGHPVRNITVATGGFIYTGEHVHNWLAATQYIAPLMANFDTTFTNDSYVKMYNGDDAFTAFWENVTVQEDRNKKFTFAVTLYKNGNIDFAYKDIPIPVQNISDSDHPVKVGISDAYLNDKIVFLVRQKTIYEYHRVSFKDHEITNETILRLVALPTCLQYESCDACVNHNTGFDCMWCDSIQKCSSGTDRNKQNWLMRNCDKNQITNQASCPASLPSTPPKPAVTGGGRTLYETDKASQANVSIENIPEPKPNSVAHPVAGEAQPHSAVSGAVGVLACVALLFAAAAWVLYAFKNPHTRSGQLLIKYRPSQWSWRRGEARYTAATIHM